MTVLDGRAPRPGQRSGRPAGGPARRVSAWLPLLLLLASAGAGCRSAALRRSLSPPHADFLSKCRYIITRSEEKVFLGLQESQRDAFIAEFWKRRDPDPYDEKNEFKDDYLSRLQEADRMFPGEGRPGWLTDRGRIYILFGPPLDRIVNPISGDGQERCSEVWYYGGFPVVFSDPECLGHFELQTADLSPIRENNLLYMHTLNQAQDEAQRTYYRRREPFGFSGRVTLTGETGRIAGRIRLTVPYVGIWFDEPAVGSLVTTLEAAVALRDKAGNALWTHREEFEVTAREEILEREQDSAYAAEIPFSLEAAIAGRARDKLKFEVILRNRTGGEEARRTMDLPAH